MFAVLAAVLVNDGWMHSSGNEKPFSKQHGSIQMVREHLHIDLRKVDAIVRVEFTFTNHGEATTVEMGFPEQTYKGGDLEKLTSSVDGRPVKVTRRLISKDEDDEYFFEYAWVKTVRFEKGQTRRIVNTYVQGLGGDTSGHRFFSYTFSTGASWFKNIEEIRVTYSFDPKSGLSYPFPSIGSKDRVEFVPEAVIGRNERKIVWKNVEPDFRFNLDMVLGFWKAEVNGLLVPPQALFVYPRGRASDLLVYVGDLEGIFGGPDKQADLGSGWSRDGIRINWKGRGIKIEGRELWADGTKRILRRPLQIDARFPDEKPSLVFLRDVVESLAGTYRYDPLFEKIYISVPVN